MFELMEQAGWSPAMPSVGVLLGTLMVAVVMTMLEIHLRGNQPPQRFESDMIIAKIGGFTSAELGKAASAIVGRGGDVVGWDGCGWDVVDMILAKIGFTSAALGKAPSAIVGRGGSGIKELPKKFKKFPGLFIQVFNSKLGRDVKTRASDCDMVYISALNPTDLKSAAYTIVEATLERAAQARDNPEGLEQAPPGASHPSPMCSNE